MSLAAPAYPAGNDLSLECTLTFTADDLTSESVTTLILVVALFDTALFQTLFQYIMCSSEKLTANNWLVMILDFNAVLFNRVPVSLKATVCIGLIVEDIPNISLSLFRISVIVFECHFPPFLVGTFCASSIFAIV